MGLVGATYRLKCDRDWTVHNLRHHAECDHREYLSLPIHQDLYSSSPCTLGDLGHRLERITTGRMKQFALATILQVAQGLQIGPSIVEVSSSFNSLYPFPNFNRNVSVPGWETSLLNGTDAGVVEDLEYLANASFISYNPDFYQVCVIIYPSVRYLLILASSWV